MIGRVDFHGEADMILTGWNVWHCYSTFFTSAITRLDGLAEKLVSTGVAEFVLDSDGHYWARSQVGNAVLRRSLELKQEPYSPRGTVQFPKEMTSLGIEYGFQACWMYGHERYLFSDTTEVPRYLRAFLRPCELTYETFAAQVFPQLKIYEDGVILTELRTLSANHRYPLKEFVNNHVNLFVHVARKFALPPALFYQYARARLQRGRSVATNAVRTRPYLKRLEAWIGQNATSDKSGDFPFSFVEVQDWELHEWEGERAWHPNLRCLAGIIEATIEGLAGWVSPWWQRETPTLGNSWSGRPAVYLLRFENQPAQSFEVIERFRTSLLRVLMRTTAPTLDLTMDIGPNLRLFSDYSFFLNKGISLFVFGCDAVGDDAERRNWNAEVYDKQIQVEFMEYRYMAHLQLASVSTTKSHRSIAEIADREQRLALLERSVRSASHFGEIQDALAYSEQSFALKEVRSEIRDNLQRKASVLIEQREGTATRFGWLLTFLLGVAGIPSFTESVVAPLWKSQQYWLPADTSLQVPFLVGVTTALLTILISAAWVVLNRPALRRA